VCRVTELQQAVLAKNEQGAQELRAELAARGTVMVNLLSSPGSGKTALLEAELTLAGERGVPVAALTADLATENDATRLARSGAPVRQVLTDGLCHLESEMFRALVDEWLPAGTRLLFVENVGNLVCPASYDLGESLRVALTSVTEGEDKPLKYPTAFGLAQLVVVTKHDLAEAVEFDRETFLANVRQVNPGVEVVFTSARRGEGLGQLLDRALAVADGAAPHQPVIAAAPHVHPHTHGQRDSGTDGRGHGQSHHHGPVHDQTHGSGPMHSPAHSSSVAAVANPHARTGQHSHSQHTHSH
jgi:hydrogenase nickel incorporation protein HypB